MADVYSGKDNFKPTQEATVTQKTSVASPNTNNKNKKPYLPNKPTA